jgi:chorismate dehydratase
MCHNRPATVRDCDAESPGPFLAQGDVRLNGDTLRIGKMAYANLFPLFYMLQKQCDCSRYEFVEGVPSELNGKIRRGEIDISPSSSIEYLRHGELYVLIEGHSISAKGPVKSIFLFSRQPIETLNGATVLTSSQSETSVALLRIILKKFYHVECPLQSSSEPLTQALRSYPAYMLIGDQAMIEGLKWGQSYQYDLGELWYRNTGLPMTFALWIVRKGCCAGGGLVEKFKRDLDYAKDSALRNLGAVAAASPLRHFLSEDELVSYWKGISYDFGEEHRSGMALFRRYAEELGII